ncbi:MAG: DUF6800 family protein [Terriglobales bacterium]
MSAPSRRPEIRRRRTRKQKIAKLRTRYAKATSQSDRDRVIQKVRLLSPTMTPEQLTEHPQAKASK